MRAVLITSFTGIDGLEVGDAPAPVARDDEILVSVKAASLGPWDLYTLQGAWAGGASGLPQVAGWDFAGETGNGRRVLGFVAQPFMSVGALAEQAAVPAQIVADLPPGLTFEQGSALPVCALTAKLVLDASQPAEAGVVLVSGAAGQVGGYIVQLARRRGLRVLAAVFERDRQTAYGLGADAVVSTEGDLAVAVHEQFPDGVDACLDTIGLGDRGLACVRDGGAFVTSVPPSVPGAQRQIEPTTVAVHPDTQALAELAELAAAGALTVRISQTFPIERAQEAYRLLERGDLDGKVVITI